MMIFEKKCIIVIIEYKVLHVIALLKKGENIMQAVKIQVLSMIFLISLWEYYRKSKKLRTSHNFLYEAIICTTFLNIFFDIITIHTVNNLSQVSHLLNNATHRIFIFTLDWFVFLLYLYMLSYARCKSTVEKAQIVISIAPIIISFFVTIFGPIDYIKTDMGNYSFGPVVNTIYLSIAFYVAATFYYYIKYRDKIENQIVIGISRALFIVAVGSLIQGLNPTLLISSSLQVLVILTLFFSFENTAEFIDKRTGAFNEYAFCKVINDQFLISKSFYVIAAYADEEDEKRYDNTLLMFDKDMTKRFSTDLYVLFEGCFAIVTKNEKAKEYFLTKIRKNIKNENILIYKLPDGDKDEDFILNEIRKLDNEGREKSRYIDAITGVRNRNAYERKLAALNESNDSKEGLWAVAIDVNNLKKTNDTYGHDKGDRLISVTAQILVEAARDYKEVYRIGGDEFVILLDNYSVKRAEEFMELLRQIQSRYNETEEILVEFAAGYDSFDMDRDSYIQDMMKRADRNMYSNKRSWHKERENKIINC